MQAVKYKIGLLQFAVALFFLATPIESISLVEDFSIVKLSSIIVLIAWALSGFEKSPNNPAKDFVPLLIYSFTSCLWSIDAVTSFNAILTFLVPSILVAMIMYSSIRCEKDIVLYLSFYVVGCLISSIAALFTRQVVLEMAKFAGEERLSAFGQDQNTLAFLLIMGVVPLLQLIAQTNKSTLKYAATAMIALISFVIASTGSRTGMIALVLCFVLFVYSAKKTKILVSSIILAIVCGAILLRFLPESITDRLSQTQELVNEGDFANRGIIWSSALKAFDDENFFLGVGYFNFSTMLRQHFGWQMSSHNTYLTYLIEFGVLGVGTFIYVLVKLLQIVRKIYKIEPNLFIYCYIMPLFVFMSTLETEYKRWLFMLYVLLFALNRLKQEDKGIQIN